jgi:hypothetical protein
MVCGKIGANRVAEDLKKNCKWLGNSPDCNGMQVEPINEYI